MLNRNFEARLSSKRASEIFSEILEKIIKLEKILKLKKEALKEQLKSEPEGKESAKRNLFIGKYKHIEYLKPNKVLLVRDRDTEKKCVKE